MNLQKRIAAFLGATLLFSLPACSSQSLDEPATETEVTATENKQKLWIGTGFNATEQAVLLFLQDRGITDRAALATILGNIKQESKFDTQICEGGRRTGYHRCYTGGFGLIQWTTTGRYRGLGIFAKNHGLDPNSLEAQLRWMVNEREWLLVKHHWETPGKSIDGYMSAAYKWLGWGVHGSRTSYAHNYYKALS
jgi:hypothetical protein